MVDITTDMIKSRFPNIEGLALLSRGGQKVVFWGKHEKYGKVVLKLVISPQPDARITREIEIATEGRIPNTARLYEWGDEDTIGKFPAFIVEEFIDGSTLRSYLEEHQRLALLAALNMLTMLIDTAIIMEQEKIVHRDIKPENIMVCSDGSFKLLDFGIARHLAKTSITPTKAKYGPHTIGYAAPEQFRNLKKEIDIRADLFAIGVVAYECLSGAHPFAEGARDHLDIMRRTEQMIPSPLTIEGDKNGNLEKFISVMMSKYPSRRPSSAAVAKDWFDNIKMKLLAENGTS